MYVGLDCFDVCEIVGFWVVYVDFVLVGWYWLECWLD